MFGRNAAREAYLEYYPSEDSVGTEAPINVLLLATCRHVTRDVIAQRHPFVFTLNLRDRQLSLAAPNRLVPSVNPSIPPPHTNTRRQELLACSPAPADVMFLENVVKCRSCSFNDFPPELTWTGLQCRVAWEREASWWWSVSLNILEVRAKSGFYRVLLKLWGMRAATSSQAYSVLPDCT